jgi:phosphatidylinositol-3-phosphatase
MTGARAVALASALAGGALWLPAVAAPQQEPVELTVSAPPLVAAKAPIRVSVQVTAEPGALDIAAQPLRLRVALEPECGGSFAGTSGPTLIDREIPAPSAGAAYAFTGHGRARVGAFGPQTVCAFVEDAQQRQFATSTDTVVDVSKACTLASRRLARLRRRASHAAGAARHALNLKLRRAGHRKRVACRAPRRSARVSAAYVAPPKIKHLFVIVLENEDADTSFGPQPPSRYLGKTLPEAGVLVPNYFGIGHESLDNYVAMISGQPPNVATQADCLFYGEMVPGTLNGDGVAIGQGCVYPAAVKTVANQLEESGRTWHGYMQDMAASIGTGQPSTCRHPTLDSPDGTIGARANDQYAARHDPFVYFHSIIDTPACGKNVVDLETLKGDLHEESTTPDYSFIAPDLCADGHDPTCADGTSPGGFEGIDAFLREWVPRIEASAAYQDRGMILVTFDESESGAEACCGEASGPNTPNNGGPKKGAGGGRVGAVMVSPCIRPGTVSDADYNHYSMLRWVEDNFGLAHLADAAPEAVGSFGSDVLSRADCDQRAKLAVRPRRASAGARTSFHFRLRADLPLCRQGATIRFAGRRVRTNRKGTARLVVRPRGRRLTARATSAICRRPATARVRVEPSG